MRLRVIDFGHLPPHGCEAAWHAVAAAMQPGDGPTLVLVSPDETYVSVGRFQVIAQELDSDHCRARHMPIIRRYSGGGVLFVERDQVLIQFIQPRRTVAEPVVDLYPRYLEPLAGTCGALGLEAEFTPINEIYVADRKIGGADAARIDEALVIACALNAELDFSVMADCLKAPSDAFRDKLRQMLEVSTTSLLKELHMMPPRDEFRRLFLKACADSLGAAPFEDEPTEAERAAIEDWARRLADDDWTFGLDRQLAKADAGAPGEIAPADATHVTPGGLISVHLVERDGTVAGLVLSGAFCCIPSDGLEMLSHRLVGEHLDEAALAAEAERTMQDIGMQMPGIGPADLAAAILAAHRD